MTSRRRRRRPGGEWSRPETYYPWTPPRVPRKIHLKRSAYSRTLCDKTQRNDPKTRPCGRENWHGDRPAPGTSLAVPFGNNAHFSASFDVGGANICGIAHLLEPNGFEHIFAAQFGAPQSILIDMTVFDNLDRSLFDKP